MIGKAKRLAGGCPPPSSIKAQASAEAMLSFLLLLVSLSILFPPVFRLYSSQASSLSAAYQTEAMSCDCLLFSVLSSASSQYITSIPQDYLAHELFAQSHVALRQGRALNSTSYCTVSSAPLLSTYGVYGDVPE
jgi:hypothetical protein